MDTLVLIALSERGRRGFISLTTQGCHVEKENGTILRVLVPLKPKQVKKSCKMDLIYFPFQDLYHMVWVYHYHLSK